MGLRRLIGGPLDALTGNRFDLDGLGRPSDNPGNNREPQKGPASRRLRGHPSIMGYPIARGQNERTGDSLLITCKEYKPPSMNLTGDSSALKLTKDIKQNGIKQKKGSYLIDTNTGKIVSGKSGRIGIKSFGASDNTLKSKRIYSVELPIPQDVNDANTVTWGDDNMNIFMLAGLTAAGNLGKKGSFEAAKELITQDVDLGGFGALDESTQNAVKAAIAGKAIDVMGGQIRPNSAIGRASGMILNSNLELLFDSVNLRSFPFSINFSPRTPKESDMVRHIIRAFKSSMAAKKGIDEAGGQGGVFLRAPDVFSLRYLHNGGQHPFLNSFKDCALTGMTVNYTNAGTYTTYDDGTPVSIRMNLTFKELNPIYHEDYIDNIPGVGF